MGTNSIKWKDTSGEPKNILRSYYKSSAGTVYPIKSIWGVTTGQDPVLIWPRDYDAILSVVPSRDINNPVPAGGGEVNLTWYLTVYYPNTLDKVPGFEGTTPISSSQIITNDDWVLYYDEYKGNYYPDFSQTNKSKLTLPDRGRNGLPASTGSYVHSDYINPNQHPYWTDGSWSYKIRASTNFTINNRTYTAVTSDYLLNGIEVCRQSANHLLNWDGTVPNTLGTAVGNWKSIVCSSTWGYYTYTDDNVTYQMITQNNPAPYTACTIYPAYETYKQEQYKFSSGDTYTGYTYFYDFASLGFTYDITNKSVTGNWISVDSNGIVTLTENTSTSARSARVYILRSNNYSSSFWTNKYTMVYQAGKPSS